MTDCMCGCGQPVSEFYRDQAGTPVKRSRARYVQGHNRRSSSSERLRTLDAKAVLTRPEIQEWARLKVRTLSRADLHLLRLMDVTF